MFSELYWKGKVHKIISGEYQMYTYDVEGVQAGSQEHTHQETFSRADGVFAFPEYAALTTVKD